jgi:hypothetical protein
VLRQEIGHLLGVLLLDRQDPLQQRPGGRVDRLDELTAQREALAAELELARATAIAAAGGDIDLAPFRAASAQADMAWADLRRALGDSAER